MGEDEHRYEKDRKGENEAEIDEENLPMTQIVRFSKDGKGVVEGKKKIPSIFYIPSYPYCG